MVERERVYNDYFHEISPIYSFPRWRKGKRKVVSLMILGCTFIQNFLNRAKAVLMVNPVNTHNQFFGNRNTEFFLSKKAKILTK